MKMINNLKKIFGYKNSVWKAKVKKGLDIEELFDIMNNDKITLREKKIYMYHSDNMNPFTEDTKDDMWENYINIFLDVKPLKEYDKHREEHKYGRTK